MSEFSASWRGAFKKRTVGWESQEEGTLEPEKQWMPKVLAYLDTLGFSTPGDLEKWDGNVKTILQFVNQVETKLQENLIREQQEQNEEDPPVYVDLDQIAASVNLTKSTFKRLKSRKHNPLPDPDIDGGGRGRKDLWLWPKIKLWLEKEYARRISFVPRRLNGQN